MKFQSFGDIMKNLIKNLGIEDQILENQAIARWPEVAGLKIAQQTEVQRIKDGILFIKVKNDVWRNELLFYKRDLILKMNEKLGKSIVADIIWV